jgi:hypothetical protein
MRLLSAMLAAALLSGAPLSAPARAQDADNDLLGGRQQERERSAPARTRTGPTQAEQANEDDTYTEGEIVEEVESWLGVSAEVAADIVEKAFSDLGRPNGYIKGGEGAGAIAVGVRYGEGDLVLRGGRRQIYWQGPSIGFDTGGNASRVFTLVYGLDSIEDIYQRYPGVEGSAYYVAGVGVNYQRRDRVTLVPMRAGVGLRLGANVGYLKYTRERDIVPF